MINHKNTGISGIRRFLRKHTLIGRITTGFFDQKVYINGRFVGYQDGMSAHIVERNGQLKHVTIRNDIERVTIYDMEFRDNKEYNGYCKIRDYDTYHFSDYVCTNGIIEGKVYTGEIEGRFIKGVFSGRIYADPKKLGCYDASRKGYNDNPEYIERKVIGYHLYEDGQHTKDCVEVSAVWRDSGNELKPRVFYSEPKKTGKCRENTSMPKRKSKHTIKMAN